MSRRYSQCDDTCTTDCGHCKGAGHTVDPAPAMAVEFQRPDPAAAVARVEALIATADERVRASVPASGAEHLIANGEHAVKVRDLRTALAGDQS